MKKEVKILGAIAIVVIIGVIIGASYYRKSQNAPAANTNSSKSQAFMETLVRADSPVLGKADAPVTMVEFLDPECEACAAFSPAVKKILKDYDGRVRFVLRYMPLHPNSLRAAALLEAAGEQGKYWETLDTLFQKQSEWGTKHGPAAASQPKPDIDALFNKYATDLGLDTARIDAAVKENRYQAKFQRDLKDGNTLGVRQTPTFFVNGRRLMRFSEQDLRALVEEELKGK